MRFPNKYALILGCAILPAFAQPAHSQAANAPDEEPARGWRKVDEPKPTEPAPNPDNLSLPAQLTLPAGNWIKVRIDQPLSSNRNQPGDQFMATLAEPLIVDGFVVARRGQTVAGQVVSVEKAGRIKGTARLGIEVNEIGLVDGRQIPIRSELIQYTGGTSKGRDATAVATTTGVGAAIGAAADGGFGAGMGAIAGAAASGIAVLATRGRAAEVYPEDVLTFRTLAPIEISTDRGERAFLPVRQQDYEPTLQRRETRRTPSLYPGAMYYPYAWGGPWGYSPYWYGPSVFFYSGPRYYRSYGRFGGRVGGGRGGRR